MELTRHPLRVLLVEDDEDDYTLLRETLKEAFGSAYVLQWVPDYRTALNAIQSEEYDVCLLDFRLGAMNGLSFLDEASCSGCRTPIIFLTGTGDYDVDIEAMRGGAADYLTKDQLKGDLLERSIRYAIERGQRREELFRAQRIIRTLSECNNAVLRTKEEYELLREICRIVVEVGGYRMAWVGSAREDDAKSMIPVAVYGHEEGYLGSVRISWNDSESGRGPTGTAIRTGAPGIVRSVADQSEFSLWKAKALERGYASVIGLPITVGGDITGALTIYASEPNVFDEEEIELLLKLSANLSYGIGALRVQEVLKKAEDERRKAYLDLERQVAERTAELVRANAELKREVAERRQSEEEQRISLRFLEIVHRHVEMAPLLEEYVQEVKEFTGCDAVGIRVLDEDWNIPYMAYDGFSNNFYEDESPLTLKSDECMCINVIKGAVDPELECYTEKGGFCVNATSKFLSTVSEEAKGRTRNRCNMEGYETVGLFPFRSGAKILGLIHVADHRENMLPSHVVAMLEKAAMQLGTSFERARAESRLRESEEHYRSLFENMLNGFAYCKMLFKEGRAEDFIYLSVNPAFEILTGLRDVVGRKVSEIIPGISETDRELLELYGKVASTGEPLRFETYVEALEMWFSISVYCPQKGYFVAVFDVITERKQAEEGLRESELKYRTLVEHIPQKIFYKDMESIYISCNDLFVLNLGIQATEVAGKTDLELFPRERAERYREEDRRVVETGRDLEVEEDYSLNGIVHTSLTRKTPVRDDHGTMQGVLGVTTDITERKRAAEAIERLRRRNELILNSVGEGILGLDLEGRLTFVNPAAVAMLGYESEELIGRKGHGLYHHTREDGNPYTEDECPIHQAVAAGNLCPITEEVFWRKDGKSFPVRYSSAPIVENGRAVGTVVTFRDVTERKLVEEEKKNLESHLHQAQKLEAIGTLAGGIAHDFNNVLGIIMGYTEIVATSLDEKSTEKDNIREVLKATNRAKDLVRQILTFSHAEDGLERRPMDIRPIMKESLKFLRAALPATIEIRQRISNKGGMVLAHPTQIHQVLTNLCTNAAHAMEEEGGILEVSLVDVELTSQTVPSYSDMKPGWCVELTVSDTGKGMDSATLERIFDPYFTTKGVGKGTGLGLPIVHGIVKGYDGAITVNSKVGAGTTFRVYLPTIAKQAAATYENDSPIPKGTESILFIDDELALAELWANSLKRLGYKVVTATGGPQALELFRERPLEFDLVITDQTMPKMTGIEIAEQMLRVRPDLRILLCTGLIERMIEERARRIGVRGLLRKPLELREAARTIREVLESES